MDSNNFDFGGDIDDDNRVAYDCDEQNISPHVTVLSGLQTFCGRTQGRQIYGFLSRMAGRAAKENGGQAGILFDDGGGCFVSFHNQLHEDEFDN
mgnify:CR=1 FL=1